MSLIFRPLKPPRRPKDWSAAERLAAVTEASGLADEELGVYLRANGLHEEQLAECRRQSGKLLLASTMRRQSMSDRTLAQMGTQLEESRSQIDPLDAATLEVVEEAALTRSDSSKATVYREAFSS